MVSSLFYRRPFLYHALQPPNGQQCQKWNHIWIPQLLSSRLELQVLCKDCCNVVSLEMIVLHPQKLTCPLKGTILIGNTSYIHWFSVDMLILRQYIHVNYCVGYTMVNAVDGRNPAPVDMVNIPFFAGFYTSQVMQDFFHQQYQLYHLVSLCSYGSFSSIVTTITPNGEK